NRPGEVGVERDGRWAWSSEPRLSEPWLRTLAVAAAAYTRQDVGADRPICSTVLSGGERCQIVLPPVAPAGTVSLTIRKPSRRRLTLEDFEAGGLFETTADACVIELDKADAELIRLR